MKRKILTIAIAILSAIIFVGSANAQYYEIANRLPGLIQPALSGSMNYRGSIEGHFLKGVGNYNADFSGISTSQGFKYGSWFFMGLGMGVDIVTSHTEDDYGSWAPSYPDYANHSSTKTGVMIPIFTDFRFDIGSQSSASFFIDLKVGASFLIGKDYLRINDGYITNQEYFYLRPSLGVRIPVNSQNTKQAVNLGVDYQLLTSNYWSSWSRNVTLSALGAHISFEW
ncbi:MAG: hypothetical protein NC097_06395 [Clostridium sp.]|nr:hypothetical protein [Prevotella sp.]MCM1429409.1 hypothetical protein [Clostridium sp.]MCM1475556.1 hypothetical protein [Muribaculaceae bacterium]